MPLAPTGLQSGNSPRTLRLPGWTERLLLASGIVLLGGLFYALDPREVLANLRHVGPGVLLIVLQEICAITANTAGWRLSFPSLPTRVPFVSVMAARLAGDAVNYLTPTASIGGEFIRVRMLGPWLAANDAAASVAVARLAQTVGLIFFLALGLWWVLPEVPLAPKVRRGLAVGLGVFAVLVTVAVLVQRRGMFGAAIRLAKRLRLPIPASLEPAVARLDERIAETHRGGSARFLLSAGAFCVGFAAGTIEVYLALWLLDLPVSVHTALAIEVLSVAFDTLVFFVPGGIGTQEAGKVLVFSLLGLPPAKGLALGILVRFRELSWALFGLALLARRQVRREDALASSSDPLS